MVCYIIPTIAAIILHSVRRKNPLRKDSQKYKSLNLLLFGGAIFGIIDHLWNRELFLMGPNMVSDIALGFVITATILFAWGVMVYFEEMPQQNTSKATN